MLGLRESSVEFQELMFDELHHRFYNSLQVLSSSIGATAGESWSSESTERLRRQISALASLHRRLATTITDLSDMRAAFAEVCICLTEGFARGRVELDLDDMIVPTQPSVGRGLMLIMIELVTNGLKHGLTSATCVRVVLKGSNKSHELKVVSTITCRACSNTRLPGLALRLTTALGGTLSVSTESDYSVHIIVPA